jgi:hypothetical protein
LIKIESVREIINKWTAISKFFEIAARIGVAISKHFENVEKCRVMSREKCRQSLPKF